MKTQYDFVIEKLHRQEAIDLQSQLRRKDLTNEMAAVILNRTVEACSDAYLNGNIEIGDQFARLNGIAEQYLRDTLLA